MSLVDPDFAAWLGNDELQAVGDVAGADAKWGKLAIDTRISSALAFKADAVTEASRQAAFRPGPLAVEKLLVPGQQVGLLGKVVALTADRGGYASGVAVFVIAADESDTPGSTRLTVLRRL